MAVDDLGLSTHYLLVRSYDGRLLRDNLVGLEKDAERSQEEKQVRVEQQRKESPTFGSCIFE